MSAPVDVIGFDACLYDVLADVVYEEGGVLFPTAAEAAEYALKLEAWTSPNSAGDGSVRTVYSNGIRERIWESCEALAASEVHQ